MVRTTVRCDSPRPGAFWRAGLDLPDVAKKTKPAPTLRIAQRQSGLERVPRGYWFVRRIGLYPIGTVLPVRVTRLPVAMSRYELYFVGYV